MSNPLNELFHPDAMGALVKRFAEQSEERSFIKIYEEGEPIDANVDGTFKWTELRYSRDLAPVTGLDAPSTSSKKTTQVPRSGTVVAIKEHVDLPARFLEGWKAPGVEVPNAAAVIANELQNLTNKVMATKNYWAAKSMLTTNGTVDLSTFPNTQIAAGSLTYPVQAISAAAAWSTAGTKIRSTEINALRKAYRLAAGLRAGRVIASSAVEGYLTGNTEISNFINGGTLAGALLGRSFEDQSGIGGVIPFGGLDWNFVADAYALDGTPDTTVELFSDLDKFAVIPPAARSRECFAIARGVQFVPVGPIAGDVASAPQGMFRQVRGMGAYVTLETAPVGLRLHVFDTLCLVQKMPKAVCVFDSSP